MRRNAFRGPRLELLEDRLAPATFTWTGGSAITVAGQKLWSDPTNWAGNQVPTGKGDDLFFPTTAPLAARDMRNDLIVSGGGPATFNTMTIEGDDSQPGYLPYKLSGNAINIGGGLLAPAGTVSIMTGATGVNFSVDITLGAGNTRQFDIDFGADLTLSGHLLRSTETLSKTGFGTLFLTQDNSAFLGNIFVDDNGGILNIKNANALGAISAGTTIGTNAQLQLDNAATKKKGKIMIDNVSKKK